MARFKMIKPGLVYPSGRPATKMNYDHEVGRLSSRESRELLKSNGSNALSNFFRNNHITKKSKKSEKKPLLFLKTMVEYTYNQKIKELDYAHLFKF